jgi:hypothetical protein
MPMWSPHPKRSDTATTGRTRTLRHTNGVPTSPPDVPVDPTAPEIEVRRANESDLPIMLGLAEAALGWRSDDPNEAFFRWKHLENPAGPSPMWIASCDGEALGFRVFMRWRFRREDGSTMDAARAVDTVTSPDHLRRGVFRRLTLHGVDELTRSGVDFIFNTPNSVSQPGYLRMGWQKLGRVPISVSPQGLRGAARMGRANRPASKWPPSSADGEQVPAVLADSGVMSLLQQRHDAGIDAPAGLTTDRTIEHLRWRYNFEPLGYRAVHARGGPEHGLAVFRIRDRGGATEAVLCELLVPPDDQATARSLLAQVRRLSRADYVLAAGRPIPTFLPLPRQGPVLTWRPVRVATPVPLGQWHLTMGDVELF